MLDAIKQFFDTEIFSQTETRQRSIEESLQIATAALLVEVTQADFEVETVETETMLNLLCDGFELSREQAEELVSLAEQEIDQARRLLSVHLIDQQKFRAGPESQDDRISLESRIR